MHWILIIILYGSYKGSVTSVPFISKDGCEAAAAQIKTDYSWSSVYGINSKCVEEK